MPGSVDDSKNGVIDLGRELSRGDEVARGHEVSIR
jgi:hypothetical protein